MPSRFIEELPKNLIKITDSAYLNKNNFIDEFSQVNNLNEDYLTPGRKRILINNQNKDIDWDLDQDFDFIQESPDSIIGQKVFHQKFGYGKVINFDGEKSDVKFDKSDLKKVFIKYLQFIH